MSFQSRRGKEDELVKWWQEIKDDIAKQPGFISGTFYKSIKPDSRFNFINGAIWENEDVFSHAIEKSVNPRRAKLGQMGAEMTPALYRVAFEY